MENKRCFNCKHAGQQFKVGKVTHLHCEHPKYTDEDFESGKLTAWDTLCKFSDTCIDHEYKQGYKPKAKTSNELFSENGK